uniref:Uncharacterized protein n=1 Tax=Vespula pensylvanica TaxID=30213 RepID=A0A834UDE3_VESPE|nr:hypothetical protein H0235_005168 [Vespula pensylvanica]
MNEGSLSSLVLLKGWPDLRGESRRVLSTDTGLQGDSTLRTSNEKSIGRNARKTGPLIVPSNERVQVLTVGLRDGKKYEITSRLVPVTLERDDRKIKSKEFEEGRSVGRTVLTRQHSNLSKFGRCKTSDNSKQLRSSLIASPRKQLIPPGNPARFAFRGERLNVGSTEYSASRYMPTICVLCLTDSPGN